MKTNLSTLNSKLSTSRGFTLIELLVVIAVIGILAAGTFVAVDPADKINAANDAKVQSDLGVLGRASEAYATSKNGYYPLTIQNLLDNGDIKVVLTPPSGYTYTVVNTPAPVSGVSCTAGSTCTAIVFSTTLKSKKYATTPKWMYESSTAKMCAVAAATTACP